MARRFFCFLLLLRAVLRFPPVLGVVSTGTTLAERLNKDEKNPLLDEATGGLTGSVKSVRDL